MDEFRRLKWPLIVTTNAAALEEPYHLDMRKNGEENLLDGFYNNLFEIDSAHLDEYQRQKATQAAIEKKTNCEKQKRAFPDPRTNMEIPSYVCDYRDQNLVDRNVLLNSFIHASRISADQQRMCLDAIDKLNVPENELSNEERVNRTTYEATQRWRDEEKRNFLVFLEDHYRKNVSHRCHTVRPAIDRFVLQKWKKRLITLHQRMSKQRYHKLSALHFAESTKQQISVSCVHEEQHGVIPSMTTNSSRLVQSIQNLSKCSDRNHCAVRSEFINSKVEQLVQDHCINVVLPLSVIRILMHSHTRNWMLPLTIKCSVPENFFNNRKHAIFGKPMPPLYMNGYERNRNANKYLLRSCCYNNWHRVYDCNSKVISDPSEDVNSDERKEMDVKYELKEFDKYMQQFHSHRNNQPEIQTKFSNVTFSVFDLTSDETDEKIRILVPSRHDAFKISDNGEPIFLNVSPKMEMQAEYGFEIMTNEELIREWSQQYFRPVSVTERIRFDCESGAILQRSEISLADIEQEMQRNGQIQPKQLLCNLWNALQQLISFPDGDYILKHEINQLNRVTIYGKSDEAVNAIDSYDLYSNVIFEKSPIDDIIWIPIDDLQVTEVHRKHRIMPCAFPHSQYYSSNKRFKAKTKAKSAPHYNEINPVDDSEEIVTRFEEKKKKFNTSKQSRLNQVKQHQTLMRSRKKQKKRQQIQFVRREQKAEIAEYQQTKDLLMAHTDTILPVAYQANLSVSSGINLFPSNQSERRENNTNLHSPPKATCSPSNSVNRETRSPRKSPFDTTSLEPHPPVVTRSGRVVKVKQL